MSITPKIYDDHIQSRLDAAEKELDNILLSKESKDYFSSYGCIEVNPDHLSVSSREVRVLAERYTPAWVVEFVNTRGMEVMRFTAKAQSHRASTQDVLQEIRIVKRQLQHAHDVIRSLIAEGGHVIRVEILREAEKVLGERSE